MMYPDRLFAVVESRWAVCWFQFPEKSASAYTSNDLLGSGFTMIPWARVSFKYFAMFLKDNYILTNYFSLFLSLVAHLFGHFEFVIFFLVFFSETQLKKSKQIFEI